MERLRVYIGWTVPAGLLLRKRRERVRHFAGLWSLSSTEVGATDR